jgi:glycosyltransferase involved in cell wall biosynthesis
LRLVLVGSRAGADALRATAARHQIGDRVRFLSGISDADLAPIYAGAVAFAFPSLAEGFGLPVLEAMQCGAPVICSDTTSLPEVAGDAAIMLSPTDPERWSSAILEIHTDANRRADLGRKSLARSALFGWDNTANVLVEAYHHALCSRESGRCA